MNIITPEGAVAACFKRALYGTNGVLTSATKLPVMEVEKGNGNGGQRDV